MGNLKVIMQITTVIIIERFSERFKLVHNLRKLLRQQLIEPLRLPVSSCDYREH